MLTTKMCHFSAWTTRAFLRRGEGPFKILLSALFFYPPFLGKLSLAFFSVLMSWEMLHMLSSPPDVVLKEEGTIAASEAFLPQGCRFFPHPPVLLHGHLCIWHCPTRTTHSCHHCLAEHPVDSVWGWLWPMVSPRDLSYLFPPLGRTFSFLMLLSPRMVLLHSDLIEVPKLPSCTQIFYSVKWLNAAVPPFFSSSVTWPVFSWVLGFQAQREQLWFSLLAYMCMSQLGLSFA